MNAVQGSSFDLVQTSTPAALKKGVLSHDTLNEPGVQKIM